VLDAGVAGHTILQGLKRWRGLVREHRPDVVVAAFGLNNEQLPCQRSDAHKLEDVRAALSGWRGAWSGLHDGCRVLQLACDLLRPSSGAAVPSWNELGGTAEVGRVDWPGLRRVSTAEFEAALAELAREVRAEGARLIFVGLPRQPEVERRVPVLRAYTVAVEAVSRREGVEYLDGAAAARAWCEAGGRRIEDLFQPFDGFHLSPTGFEMLAERLAVVIAEGVTTD